PFDVLISNTAAASGYALPGRFPFACQNCKHQTNWSTFDGYADLLKGLYQQQMYFCQNCSRSTVTFFLKVMENNGGCTLVKIGQDPAQTIQPPPSLEKLLNKTDTQLLRSGLVCHHHSLG